MCHSGLGYIAGAFMAEAFGGWQWALRVSLHVSLFYCSLCCTVTFDQSTVQLHLSVTDPFLRCNTSVNCRG